MSQHARAVILVNPSAGDPAGVELLQQAAAQLDWLTLWTTASSDETETLAARAADEGFPTVIAAGGDGTLHHVVNGLGDRIGRVRIGVVPMGTANDFATALGIPVDPRQALSVIEHGHPRPIDLVRCRAAGTRPCFVVNAITGGLSWEATQRLDDHTKQRWGVLSYLRAAAGALPRTPRYRFRLRCDDRQEFEVPARAVMLANGGRAGGWVFAPRADPADGKLDVLIATSRRLADEMGLLAAFTLGDHLEDDALLHTRCASVDLHAEPVMHLIGDGEPAGHTPTRFEIAPGAARFITPTAI